MNLWKNRLERIGLNTFFFLLIISVVLAYWFPHWGTEEAFLPLSHITYYGVAVIFFFYGVKLSPDTLVKGLSNWRLHLLVQSTTFLVFPIVILFFYYFFGTEGDLLWIGVFYLAALPSTVSSSVVMVSIAGGNLAAAIFNASISSIVGIFITPVWMDLFLSNYPTDFDLKSTFLKLVLQILLPVILGFLSHRYLFKWVMKFSSALKKFDQLIILLIVFTAFSESFAQKMFDGKTLEELLLLSLAMLLLFLLMLGTMYYFGTALHLDFKDRITVLFCGSKKSLVQGAVMGKVMFPDPVILGVILLPLMIYHSIQLMVGSAIAERLGRKEKIK